MDNLKGCTQMRNGWICLHRKLIDNPIFDKPNYLSVWIYILLSVNSQEGHSFMWNNERTYLKRGQGIISQLEISKKYDIPRTTVGNILKCLKMDNNIDIKTTTKFTIVTVLNWIKYQDKEHQNGQRMDNKRTTDGQQMDTLNNITIEQYNNKTKNKEGNKSTSYGNELINFFEREFKKKFGYSPTFYSKSRRNRRIWNLVSRKVFNRSTEKIAAFIKWLGDYCEGNNITIERLDTVIEKCDLWEQT